MTTGVPKKASAQETIAWVRRQTSGVILFCSLGKDSLVTLDMIYPHFPRIVCVFMYFVKGLDHIEWWLRYIRARYPKIELLQVPHWNLAIILKTGLYCTADSSVKFVTLSDVVEAIRARTGLYYTFLGMKKADSMNRRVMLMTYEGNENNGLVYPLAEWTQKDVLAYMRHHKMPQPVRYSLKASSGVGFNVDCMLWMEERYPQDLKKLFAVFPLAERELWRHKQKLLEQNEQDDQAGADEQVAAVGKPRA